MSHISIVHESRYSSLSRSTPNSSISEASYFDCQNLVDITPVCSHACKSSEKREFLMCYLRKPLQVKICLAISVISNRFVAPAKRCRSPHAPLVCNCYFARIRNWSAEEGKSSLAELSDACRFWARDYAAISPRAKN